jgi:apolipoprotein N-acyltransferase
MPSSSSEPAAPGRARWRPWAAAILSAALLELPFPIAGPMPPWRGIFAWFALVPLLWAVLSADAPEEKKNLRRAFLLAYVCGVLWYMGNCYWIYDTMHIHGELPPLVSFLILLLFSLVLGLYFGLFGLGLALVQKKTGSTRWALLFAPFLWTALELAGARITSVPWDQLGYSQVDNGIVNRLAPLTGAYGISFLLVAFNALLAGYRLHSPTDPVRRFRVESWGLVVIPALLLLGNGYLAFAPPQPSPTATAVLIQPDLDVEHTGWWQGPGEWDAHMAQFTQLATDSCKPFIAGIPQTAAPTLIPECHVSSSPPDLVVWPESPAPYFEQDPRFRQSMAAIAQTDHAPLIVNGIGSQLSPAGDSPGQESLDYVSAMVFNAQGAEIGRYDKMHLVPWGEYVPYAKFFFFARKLTGKVSAFTPGTERKTFLLAGQNQETHRYGVFICYEAVFADEVRQFAKLGAQVLVNISDDGWYGDTSAPWQHLNMTRMRAIENRRWLLRDTNNGVTAAIDPWGRVRQSIPRHQIDALPAQYGFRSDITFYTAHGDLFAWLCVILSLGVVGWCIARRKSC